jgi:FKBP-type peptidyl-prolyl cis-trans isomerase
MTISTLKRAIAAILTPAILFGATSSFAATPKPAKAATPVLACKTAAADGLTYTIIKAGKGDKPGADANVKVNYKGMLTSDGKEFDSGKTAQGLQLMQPGSSYRLCIPSKLGYGEAGTGPIPANADLVFEVELLSFTTPPPKPVVPLAERTCVEKTVSGLGYLLIKTGSGNVPTDGDIALVDYTTFNANTGEAFDIREWEKVPVAQATAVFGEALKMMPSGSRYTFCLPNMEIGHQYSD